MIKCITQDNYPTFGTTVFFKWYTEPVVDNYTVAIFKIKYKNEKL